MATQISNENLRQLCIKNDWFTEGSIRQYEKLFYANENGCPLEEIATIIWVCSNVEKHCRRDILFALKEASGTSIPESADKNKTIDLPCKVGDEVYLINDGNILELDVKHYNISNDETYGYTVYLICKCITAGLNDVVGFNFTLNYGKTVFLTRAEAEKALKEASK